MGVLFTESDLEVFEIVEFSRRMAALKEKIRPKLVALGEEIAPALKAQFKTPFYPHTAKHMRRKVRPTG